MNVVKFLKLQERIWKPWLIRKGFRRISFLLENGTYCFKDYRFYRILPGEKVNPLRRIIVSTSEKNPVSYDHGLYVVHRTKSTFIFDDNTYQVETSRAKFNRAKSRYEQYYSLLPYRAVPVSFDDDKCIMTSETQKEFLDRNRLIAVNRSHFDESVEYLFTALSGTVPVIRQMEFKDSVQDVYFCVQHGDCHNMNFFWTEAGPRVIDLDTIKEYPLFFDIIYYVHSFMSDKAFEVFSSTSFLNKAEETLDRLGIPREENPLDRYLAAYVYTRSNRMDYNTPYRHLRFSLIGITAADLSKYPMTAAAVQEYRRRVKHYGRRLTAW